MLEYQNFISLRDIWWSKFILFLYTVYFFYSRSNWTSMAAQDSYFSAQVSKAISSIYWCALIILRYCWSIKISFYLETSGGQSLNLI